MICDGTALLLLELCIHMPMQNICFYEKNTGCSGFFMISNAYRRDIHCLSVITCYLFYENLSGRAVRIFHDIGVAFHCCSDFLARD